MKLKKLSEVKYGDKYNYNVMNITDSIDDLKYWCDGISEVFGEDDFKKNVVSYFNSLDKVEQRKLAEELDDIVELVNNCWNKLDKLEEKMNNNGFGFSESVGTKHNKNYLIKEDYYDDIMKFYEANKDTIKNIVSKNGFGYIYKPFKTMDSTIAIDVDGSRNSDTNALEKDLRRFIKKFDFDFYIQELTSKPLGSVRIHFYY